MPFFDTKIPQFKPRKSLQFDWNNWKGGLNTFFKATEISGNEVSQFDNLMLVGKGIPTKRWGDDIYFLSGSVGAVRGLRAFYQKDGTKQLLSVDDNGLLTRRSNASYIEITGVSWASGLNAEMIQLDNMIYIVNGQRELARYSNPTLVGFPTIGQPSAIFATQISGISGTNTYSYVLTHTSQVGETAPAGAFELANQPIDPSLGSVKLQWTNASTASGIRTGTNIYGRSGGNETFIASVDGAASQFVDNGNSTPQLFGYPPDADSTGGPIAKYIIRFNDRLIFAGINNDPTLVLISGRVPNHEKFDFGNGGGFVRVEPDSGDEITGLEVKGQKILVFKERSIWELSISQVQIGNFYLIEPKYDLVTRSVGCASQRSIIHVENDIFFLASFGKGVYVIGNEANFATDIFRINELSLKVRDFFTNLTTAQEQNSCAVYYKNKYLIGIPGKDKTMVFDRERIAWVGPWGFDATVFETFVDENDIYRLLYGKDNEPQVNEIDNRFPGDEGVAINTIMRSKREDYGLWNEFKNQSDFFTRWRNVSGSVNVDFRLEKRDGNTITQNSFSVTTGAGNSGWGADLWGGTQWADSEETGVAADLAEIIRWGTINRPARNIQFVITTTGLNDNYELLALKGEAQPLGAGLLPASTRV